ncbi:MAG: PaaI family thioesterase [Parvularculaceae bacterium]
MNGNFANSNAMSKIDPNWKPREAPPGWRMQTLPDTFSYLAGPYYWREEGPTPGVAFYSEPHHCNMGGILHGGALLTLADMSMFDIAFRAIGRFRAVTVSMNSDFLAPGPVGEFIEASGELLKGGKSLLFVRGVVSTSAKKLMSFSGTLRRSE